MNPSLAVPFAAIVLAAVAITVFVLRAPRLRPAGEALPVTGGVSGFDGVSGVSGFDGVSVVIPARNEADTVGLLLADLAGQAGHRAAVEVIVVDDESTDATAAVARAAGATVLTAGPRPPGWNPKVWALWLGAAHTRHEEVVFLDADVRLGPGALAAVVCARQRAGGLLSVAPHHRAVGPIESLSAACNVLAVAGGGPGLARQAAGAVGSCVAVQHAEYSAVGGHGARPATIVDDLDLAASYRAHGLAVSLRRGGALVSMRSYPGGFAAVWAGWSKNLAAGMGRTPVLAGLVIAGWIASLVLPLALLAQQRWWAAAAAWAVTAAHAGWLCRRVGRFNPVVTTVGAPLLGLFTTALTVRSLLAALTGRTVSWKGRALRPDGLETDPTEAETETDPTEADRRRAAAAPLSPTEERR